MRRSTKSRTTGQTLVLGAMTLFLVAVLMMVSFTLANAIHERIRIQASADAQAYSAAVVQARAFNTFAYTNRAIAASLVSVTTIHAWYGIAKYDESILVASAEAMVGVAYVEQQVANAKWASAAANTLALNFIQAGKDAADAIKHEAHAFKAGVAAFRLGLDALKYHRRYNQQDGRFKAAVNAFSDAIKRIHGDQKMVKTSAPLLATNIMREVNTQCAPNATPAMGLALLNKNAFDNAIATGNGGNARGDIMMDAAMDSRPGFDRGGFMFPTVTHADFTSSVLLQAGRAAGIAGMAGTPFGATILSASYNPGLVMSRLGNEGNVGWAGQAIEGRLGSHSGSAESSLTLGGVAIQWKHGVGFGLSLTFGRPRTRPGGTYKGSICQNNDNCFTNYKGSISRSDDMNQPSVYAGAKQDLRLMRNNRRGPWEMNNGRASMSVGDNDLDLSFVPTRDGVAVSKAKTYFHQLGGAGWKKPPNFFDPFWRAKLHPFNDLREMMKAVAIADPGSATRPYVGSVEGK